MRNSDWSAWFVLFLSLTVTAPGAKAGPPHKGAPPHRVAPKLPNVSVQGGYFLHPLATGLNFPTAITFAGDRIWVSEAGIPPSPTPPRVVRVDKHGGITPVLSAAQLPMGALLPPLTDVTYQDGWLWITHRQRGQGAASRWVVGAISRFRPENPAGTFATVITNLPNAGDHHTDEILFDGAGRAYFSVGTATNSSVVGPDNYLITGWLKMFPDFHDFPAKNIRLSGVDYQTPVPFPLDPDARAITAPFMPFGSGPVAPETGVPAATPENPQSGIIAGNGAIYSFDPSAANPTGTLRLEAWGLRNPFGIGLDPFHPGLLFSTNNGADVRGVEGENTAADQIKRIGARPIANDWDDLFVLPVGGAEEFFGWPDYFHNPANGAVLPVTNPLFGHSPVADIPQPQFVLSESFRSGLNPLPAFAQFEHHASANKFDFSTDRKFKAVGDLFVAETGSFVPITGARQFVGYKVVRVDRTTGQVHDFIVNTGDTPEEIFDPDSFNKPIDAKFRGEILFIVDFGVFEPGLKRMKPGTGKVWIVSHGKSGIVHLLSGN